jgi:vitamin B12 transporter
LLARFTVLVLALLFACAASSVRAHHVTPATSTVEQPPAPVEVTVHSRRKMVAAHALDPTASGTSLDLTDRVTMPRSLGDVVREAPGALVRNTGGPGAFSSVSLRGADTDETLVLLDEIPLSTPDGGAFDLSLFPAELFEKVNVFRSGAPAWLGSGAIGGVLQLVPRRREENGIRGTLGAGSFGTYQLHGGTDVAIPHGLQIHTQIFMRGTEGNYPYRDDRGTLYDRSDDLTFRRKNADFVEASGMQDLTLPLWGGTLHLLALGVQRGGGFPGPGSQPTPKIRRESSRALAALSFTREVDEGGQHPRRLQLVASGAYSGDRFVDLYGQLGTSKVTATDDRGFRAFVRSAGSLRIARWLDSTLVSSYAFDTFLPFNRYVFPQPEGSTRHTVATAFELEASGSLGRVRFALRPSARIEWSRSELHAPPSYMREYDANQTVLAPTLRVGGVIEPVSYLTVSASVSTGRRLPTVFELFGDRGLVLPSVNLKPVDSMTYDGGVTVKKRWGDLRVTAELRGFVQERQNAIAMFRTAQFQVGHENLSAVRQWGIESGLRGSLGEFFDLSGSFTWLDTDTALDKRLPFRPRYVAYVRPEGKLAFANKWVSEASLSAELWHRSFAFVDYANLAYTGACMKVALGVAVTMFERRIRLSARMDDSADARCTDLVGYPLPGRSTFFSVTYQEVTDAHDET